MLKAYSFQINFFEILSNSLKELHKTSQRKNEKYFQQVQTNAKKHENILLFYPTNRK